MIEIIPAVFIIELFPAFRIPLKFLLKLKGGRRKAKGRWYKIGIKTASASSLKLTEHILQTATGLSLLSSSSSPPISCPCRPLTSPDETLAFSDHLSSGACFTICSTSTGRPQGNGRLAV